MKPEVARMQDILTDPDRIESKDNMKIAMRLLIRSANLDRRLIADKDWQTLMTRLHSIIQK